MIRNLSGRRLWNGSRRLDRHFFRNYATAFCVIGESGTV